MTHTHAYTHTDNVVFTLLHEGRNVLGHAITNPIQRPMLALPIQDAIQTGVLLPTTQSQYDAGWIAALLECEPEAFVTKELAKPCSIWEAISTLDTIPDAMVLLEGMVVATISLVGHDQFDIAVVAEDHAIDHWTLTALEALQADIRVVL